MLPSRSSRLLVSSSASSCAASAALTSALSCSAFFRSSARSSGRPWKRACRAISARNGARRTGPRTTCAVRRRRAGRRRGRRPLHGRAGRREHGRGPHEAGEGQSPLQATGVGFGSPNRYCQACHFARIAGIGNAEDGIRGGVRRRDQGKGPYSPKWGRRVMRLDVPALPRRGVGRRLSTGVHGRSKLSTGCEEALWTRRRSFRKPHADSWIHGSNPLQTLVRVGIPRPKELIIGIELTTHDPSTCGPV